MFNQTNWWRWTLLFVLLLTATMGDGTERRRSQTVGPTQPAPILTGKWKLDTGETVDITQGASGQVTAKFNPVVSCWGEPRTTLFTGTLTTTGSGSTSTVKIEDGRFWACTRNEKMWKDCGLDKIFETQFRATVSPLSISGENFRDGYWIPGGDFTKCRRDSKYDEWSPFSLTPLCPPSTSWFDRGTTNCQETRSPEILADSIQATVRICGFTVFQYRFTDTDTATAPYGNYGAVLEAEVKRQVGTSVCCDTLRQAATSGQPCNPGVDFDCDGRPNEIDVKYANSTIPLPEINIFSTAVGANVAPFPAGVNPDEPGFVPDSSGCDCKWSLIRGVMNCGSGGQGYTYTATWQCPTTGARVATRKQVATGPCQ